MNVPNRGALIGVVALVATVLSGCLDQPTAEDGASEANVATAMESFQAAMANSDDSKLKSMVGTVTTAMDEGDATTMTIGMEFEWGLDDILYVAVDLDAGGMQMHMETWCTPDGILLKWGNEVYEERPPLQENGQDECNSPETATLDDFSGDGSAGPLGFFETELLERLDAGAVQTNDDGTLVATFTDPETGDVLTVHVDKKSRVTRVEMSGNDGTGTFDIHYGPRERLELPTPNGRIPASIGTDWDFAWDDEPTVHTVDEVDALLPLDEFEARWVAEDWESDTKEVIATFSLTDGRQQAAGVTFEYFDVDSDGRISVGDRYEYQQAADVGTTMSEPSDLQYDMELYDLWAAGYANETPIPAPGIVGLLAVLGVALVALRRRG